MSFTEDLLTGLAAFLAPSVPDGQWSPAAAYTGDVVGFFTAGFQDRPARAVSLLDYPVRDEVEGSDSTVGVQFISRGTADRRTALRIDDAIFDTLHNATALTLNGVYVVQAYRRSGVSLGQDQNRRWLQSSNYYLDLSRPTNNRVD